MEKDKLKTYVVFLIHKENNELFAYFPYEKYHSYKSKIRTCYAHIGQHSACSPEYAKESRLATEQEYKDLRNELESIGYNLEILDGLKRKNAISKIVYPVNCKFGAPMGRSNQGIAPKNARIYDRKVPMSADSAYDKGGAYWGLGKELRVRYTADLQYIEFYRQGEKTF